MFDNQVNRIGTGSVKWDLLPATLPYWIADMDFKSPDCILEALQRRVEHGVFGYALEREGFRQVLVDYMQRSHGASISPDWIVHMCGCVPALATTVQAFCSPGDSVMTCTPVYPPIRSVHASAGATLIEVPHILSDGQWNFDWDAMERAVLPDTKLFILCNPQNPLGRVFGRGDILRLAEFCHRHDLILCSDEIHCDLVLDEGVRHTTVMTLPEPYLQKVVMLTAPSKTYNIAGIGYSMILIPSEGMRAKFEHIQRMVQPPVHCLAFEPARVAYSECEDWRRGLIAYLRQNRDTLYQFVRQRMPRIGLHPMQATYLAWMDCSALGLNNPQEFFIRGAGVFLNSGEPFGAPQHVRFNFGTSRANMLEGLEKMAEALDKRPTV